MTNGTGRIQGWAIVVLLGLNLLVLIFAVGCVFFLVGQHHETTRSLQKQLDLQERETKLLSVRIENLRLDLAMAGSLTPKKEEP